MEDNALEHTDIIVTIIVSVLGSSGLWAFLQNRSTAKSASERMILGLAHAEIFRQCEHYLRRDGITKEELEDLDKYLFRPYKELGGNGTAESMVEQCRKLKFITAAEAAQRDLELHGGKAL